MAELVDVISDKHKELSELVQKKSEFLTNTNGALKQLRGEKRKVLAEIQEISGAIQAYGAVINLIKPPVVEAEDVTDAPSAPVSSSPVTVEGSAEVVSEPTPAA